MTNNSIPSRACGFPSRPRPHVKFGSGTNGGRAVLSKMKFARWLQPHHGACCRPQLPPQPRDGKVPFIR